MQIPNFDPNVVRVRLALRVERFRRNLRPRGRRAATYVLGAALGLGGVSEAYEGVAGVTRVDPRVVSTAAKSELAGASALAPLAVPAEPASVEIHPLIRQDWLPAEPAAPLEGETVKIITESVRESFFRADIPYGRLIHEKAEKYDVDPLLVAAVVQAESSFRARAVSSRGARGLMQLMPATGRWMGARNLSDPAQNLDAGVKYLKYLERRFDGNRELQLAAYNAGEGNVRKYGGVPPFRETRAYVRKVSKNYDRHKRRMERYEHERSAAR